MRSELRETSDDHTRDLMFVLGTVTCEDAANLGGRDWLDTDSYLGCEVHDLADSLSDPGTPPGTRVVDILENENRRPVEPDECADLFKCGPLLVLTDVAQTPVDQSVLTFKNHEAEASGVEIDRENTNKPSPHGSGSSR